MDELFSENQIVIYTSITIASVITIGVAWDLIMLFVRYYKKKRTFATNRGYIINTNNQLTFTKNPIKTLDTEITFVRKEINNISKSLSILNSMLEKQNQIHIGTMKNESFI